MKKLSILALGIFALASFDANAFGRENKFYAFGGLGYNYEPVKKTATGGPFTTATTIKTNNRSVVGELGAGYYILDELRLSGSFLFNPNLTKKKNPQKKTKFATTIGNNEIVDKTQLGVTGAFVDLYYDMLSKSKVNPNLSIGFGHMQREYKDFISITDTSALPSPTTTSSSGKLRYKKTMYRIGMGVSYHMNTSVDIDFGYKLHGLFSMKKKKNGVTTTFSNSAGSATFKPAAMHLLTVGLRYTF